MKVLLLDSDSVFSKDFKQNCKVSQAEMDISPGGQEAIRKVAEGGLGVLFATVQHLTLDNLDLITLAKDHNPGVEILVLCEKSETDKAQEAVNRGANSFFIKPVQISFLESQIRKVMTRALTRKNHRLLEDHIMVDLLGMTPAMDKIRRTIAKVAPTNSNILIEGETGTGKEFIANLIHRMSNRPEEPFVAVNCAAIPESLIEAELFGARKGAYTGSVVDRKGLFEEADHGTLFLDEIGELPTNLQVKILRFLQEKEVRRVGETESRFLDVRVIAATNINLARAVSQRTFREDLYYRLNVFHLQIPPLRERKVSIPHLLRFFVNKYGKEHGVHIKGIAKDAELLLLNYDYPGNIRELENIVEHAVVLCEDGEYILKAHLPEFLLHDSEVPQILSLPKTSSLNGEKDEVLSLSEVEKRYIIKSLQTLSNNQSEVAKRLGISRSTLWRKIKEHGIQI